jgi:hypothetical protein
VTSDTIVQNRQYRFINEYWPGSEHDGHIVVALRRDQTDRGCWWFISLGDVSRPFRLNANNSVHELPA